MSATTQEAVEAAARAILNRTPRGRLTPQEALEAAEAALPFLARPAPSQSDDLARAGTFIGLARRTDSDGMPYFQADWLADLYASALAAVRAEATLAEREATLEALHKTCDVIGAKPGSSIWMAFSAAEAAIRARKP